MALSKQQLRIRRLELRDLVNSWDPLGLIEMGAPEDEYDCVVAQLLPLLANGSTPEAIAAFLADWIPHHFGVAPDVGAEDFSRRIVQWFSGWVTDQGQSTY